VFLFRGKKRGEGEIFWRQVLFSGGCDLDCFGEVKDIYLLKKTVFCLIFFKKRIFLFWFLMVEEGCDD